MNTKNWIIAISGIILLVGCTTGDDYETAPPYYDTSADNSTMEEKAIGLYQGLWLNENGDGKDGSDDKIVDETNGANESFQLRVEADYFYLTGILPLKNGRCYNEILFKRTLKGYSENTLYYDIHYMASYSSMMPPFELDESRSAAIFNSQTKWTLFLYVKEEGDDDYRLLKFVTTASVEEKKDA